MIISKRQLELIYTLAYERGVDLSTTSIRNMSREEASQLIKELQELPKGEWYAIDDQFYKD